MKLPEHKLKKVDYYEVREGLSAGRNKQKDVVIVHWKDEIIAEVPPLLDWIPGLQSLFTRSGGSEHFEFKRRREVAEDKGGRTRRGIGSTCRETIRRHTNNFKTTFTTNADIYL